jgi:3-hydroxyacyl-CoA dehydrogenase/enoyl-CoA hydratase/3-hydroxybutyryl-CoA epimerase
MELGPFSRRPASAENSWSHWKLARDEEQVAWLLFDMADSAVNTLSEPVLQELGEILDTIGADLPRGLVLRSAKASNFCVGADLDEFRELADTSAITAKLRDARRIADRLADLSCPTVAIVHGSCLGGGLELALCCDYRLALPNTETGFPEIRLGLHPGMGGTVRLTQLIDPVEAMTMLLTGKTVDAESGLKSGLLDQLVEERHVAEAVRAAVAGKIARRAAGLKKMLFTAAPARHLAARQMRSKSAEKARPEHYPAPEALIALWEEHGGEPETMHREEIRSFARLLTTPTAQNLLRVFFLRQKLKRATDTAADAVRQVHVVGAGAMGGDIAAWCALKGLRVSLHDTDAGMIAKAVGNAAGLCRARRLSEAGTREVLDRLIPDLHNQGAGRADLVIEAVPEKIELKHKVYRTLEPLLKPGAVLATNTSSIPLQELRRVLEQPGRFVGLHFFNPVAKMQLVEVVEQEEAEAVTLEKARAFVGRIGRLPVPVASAPGFLVNRVLMPYLLEAIVLLDEGVAGETIDSGAEAFGMPMGPVELADQVGLDICLDVADMLRERLDRPLAPVPQWLRDKVAKGELGRKTGQGFYPWKEGKPRKKDSAPEAGKEIIDRLLLPLLNACMACLGEEVVGDEELLDGAMIFGTGFAPFRGGPMHYARSRGWTEIAETLAELAARHGERFEPDPGWSRQK